MHAADGLGGRCEDLPAIVQLGVEENLLRLEPRLDASRGQRAPVASQDSAVSQVDHERHDGSSPLRSGRIRRGMQPTCFAAKTFDERSPRAINLAFRWQARS
jgi:hypothetical protein